MKKLSETQEKVRRSMSKLKIGQLVWDSCNGYYSIIRGFQSPWIYILQPCEEDCYCLDDGEKTYTVHFTDLSTVSKEFIQTDIKKRQQEVKQLIIEWKKIAKMGGIKL